MKFLQSALLALAAASAVVARPASELPVPGAEINGSNIEAEFETKALFNQFQQQYQKSYAADEVDARYQQFRTNLLKIAMLNEKNGSPAFGINQFADMSEEEFKATKLGYTPARLHSHKDRARHATPVTLPTPAQLAANVTKIDWRTKGAVTPVKDQGQCGSCWAFSATSQIESAWFLAGKGLPVLSPQQVVSCDSVDQGCNGGDTPTAYAYVKGAGLEPDAKYPYTSGATGDSGTCAFVPSDVTVRISGFTYATPPCSTTCDKQDEATMAANIAAKGPASICVNAAQWQLYSSGVLSASACGGSAYTDLDHCVQVVGYDLSQSTPYWIVRNSWNTGWGAAGYIYVEYGTNACGIADEATFVTI